MFVLEETQKGTLTSQSAAEVAKAALLLLSNASVQTAKERRKKVTKDLSKTLAEDLEMFEEVAPFLFGASFEKKMLCQLPVQLPTIWHGMCPMNLHQGPEANCCPAETSS